MSLRVVGAAAGYGRMPVLEDVSIEVPSRTIVSVVGANGAGKSTLAKAISGLLRLSAGSIEVDGTPIDGLRPERRAKSGLVHVPEGRRLFGQLTVAENIAMGRQAARGRNADTEVVDQLLDSFPILRERWNQRAGLLSGGEQQMVALTRAAASRPRYLLLDEPSLGLSPRLSSEVLRLVGMIADETGAGVLLIEQRVDAALRLASSAYVLDRGRIVAEGPADELRESDEIRKAYLGM
ncbi:ABC transporter ATP-binding protein [Aeromicrobium alkaliterrae]|uniref:ABC transporter ATP-binding protein n=1 Tax=Aeromicrobium alkaliterrae TaxID=302168 RepID=A0ABP4W4B7_9ACTN